MYSNREFQNDGYILLASAILEAYREDYANLFPRSCKTYSDFLFYDTRDFAPLRKTLLNNLQAGPLRSVVDVDVCRRAFEQQRHENMRDYGITWECAYD